MGKCIDEIWEEFSKPLYSFIKKRVSNPHDAEDILQNIFYKIIKNIEQLNEMEKMHAWIYKIAKNSIIDYYRVSNNKIRCSNLKEEIIDETEDEMNENAEIALCLKTMIYMLPEKYKQAIILTEFHNMTQKKAAEILGLSESGFKSRVQRARLKLKEMLLNCCRLEVDYSGNIIDYEHKHSECKFCCK